MKKVVLFFLSLIMVTNAIKAQEAPKNSNVIIIKTTENIDDSFKKVGRILIHEGYELETADKDFYMITTKITQKKYGLMGGGSLEVKFNIQFDQSNDSTIIKIIGFTNSAQLATAAGLNNDSFDKDAIRVQNKGANGSIIKSSWIFMDEIAKKYMNGTISYIIEESK